MWSVLALMLRSSFSHGQEVILSIVIFTWHMIDYSLSLRDIFRVNLESLVVHVWFKGSSFYEWALGGDIIRSLLLLLGAICYLSRIFNDEWASPVCSSFPFLFIDEHGRFDGRMRSPFFEITGVERVCWLRWTSIGRFSSRFSWAASLFSSTASDTAKRRLGFLH